MHGHTLKSALLSILAMVLVAGVVAAYGDGIFAGFSDTETSTDNKMCSGNLVLELQGEPIQVEYASPLQWYYQDCWLINLGTRSGVACVTITKVSCVEDAPGAGIASSEPELVAEEGGYVGSQLVPGLGVDICDFSNCVDMRIWYDLNGDGDVEDAGELIVDTEKLCDIADLPIELGELPAAEVSSDRGSWGQYFIYHVTTDAGPMVVPLIAGQTIRSGSITVSNNGTNLYVTYGTTGTGWEMDEAHLYVGKNAPPKMAPGKFPYGDDVLPEGTTSRTYTIPLADIPEYDEKMKPIPGSAGLQPCQDIYIAAHAVASTDTESETAWARPGGRRLVRIALCIVQVEDPAFPPDDSRRWWPTNAYQGDFCYFDILFELDQSSLARHWYWTPDDGLVYGLVERGG